MLAFNAPRWIRTVFAVMALAPIVAQAEQWEPDVMVGAAPVSVIVQHQTDGVEVTGPTGLRAIVFTVNGYARFKDKAKITVTTTTPQGKIVSRTYLFDSMEPGPLNVSFRIGDDNLQFDALFAQLKNATAIHAVVNDTNLRFDASGLRPNFDVYTHQN
ncbi:hypothetical protein [Paraburkholderia sp. BL17N1]|uniref:hypothetical protein n=1 Tax=Paraburkholderia sp. BL17N1 TaxID=1938798 RepID=UPI000EB422FD|nr:hypothetical protein [Paraburkholderia sp. BL17N1]RKR31705.1 hypothetical protein B0G82_7943 [Paraburkholderia sp. BL17N1]